VRGVCQCTDDGGSNHLWNFGKLLLDYTAQQLRRQPPSSLIHIYNFFTRMETLSWVCFFTWHSLEHPGLELSAMLKKWKASQ
jgi:hypothetical protein